MASLNSIFNQTRNLPNMGGTYSLGAMANSTPATLIRPVTAPAPVTPPITPAPRIFSNPNPEPVAPVVPSEVAPVQEEKLNIPRNFINPSTGQLLSAKEIVANMAKKIPLTNAGGDVGKYAGDAVTAPDQSVETLETTARNLNNARNDIATGVSDPFKVGKDSGIAYNPTQLAAIEKAYAGIYDPAINDVFTRIKQKQKLDEELAQAKTEEAKLKIQKEMAVFNTNENIRQWQATTGSKKGSGGDGDMFTRTQLNNGAANAGVGLSDFDMFDDDVKNFYINPPKVVDPDTNKSVPQYEIFSKLMDEVESGARTSDEVVSLITDSKTLPPTVKQYFISKMPTVTPAEKQKHWYDIFINWMK